ncbi:MAG TPA: hypothetical protein VMF90_12320 [Rhizobiaceae bacterium]|nr:hypothetical protein [Rhizobiaceae bacterium]
MRRWSRHLAEMHGKGRGTVGVSWIVIAYCLFVLIAVQVGWFSIIVEWK